MAISKLINIPIDSLTLEGKLEIPDRAHALVIFAHGSGSSRYSPRNNFVAEILQDKGLATLLFDLLTEEEDASYDARFDIKLLMKRLIEVTQLVKRQEETKELAIGYFGSSTGAAAALKAAAQLGDDIGAIVSRGGRPDLAMDILEQVSCPTLLIVGEEDDTVLELNREAYEKLDVEKHLAIIPGASHLFQEEGALEEVAHIACEWFLNHL